MGMKRRIKARAFLGSSILGVELLDLGSAGFVYFWGWNESKSVVIEAICGLCS